MALTKVKLISDGVIVQGNLHSSHGITTAHIAEGTSSDSGLYYTNARVDSRIAAASTSDLSEGSNLYYTDARADARITAASTSDLSEGTNLYYTDARADARVALIVDSSPATLNTLNELAAALGDDPNFATTTATSIGTKLPLAGGTLTGDVNLLKTLNSAVTSKVTNLNTGSGSQARFVAVSDGGNIQLKSVSIANTTYGAGDVGVINCDTMSGGFRIAHNDVTKYTLAFNGENTWTGGGTFGGTVQATQFTATNGLNYLKRNTDASLQLRSENTRSGLFITKPATDTVMGSALVMADESYRLGTANYYHQVMLQDGNTYFNQNVGIGTTSPMTKLHIQSGNGSYPDDANNHLVVESSSHSYIGLGGGTSSDVGIHFGDSGGIAQGRIAYKNSDNSMRFMANSSERLTILSSGNVGIGETAPAHKLSIKATDDTRGILVNNTLTTSYAEVALKASREFRIGTGGSASDINARDRWYVYDATANTHRLTLDSLGNFGIGTTTPDNKLQVVAGNAQLQAWFGETSYTNAAIRIGGENAAGGRIYLQYDGDNSYIDSYGGHGSTQRYRDLTIAARNIKFVTGNTSGSEKVRITEAGGITFNGDTASANALDDYEEGTWTPTVKGDITAGTATYGAQGGSYTKIGNKVTCWFSIMNFTQSGASGAFTVASLPFTCITTSSVRGCFGGNLRFYNMDFPDGFDVPSTNLDDNAAQFYILWSRDNSTWINQPVQNSGNQYFEGYVTYSTA